MSTRYGLLGYPVHHSLSPCMHNAAFRYLKRKARYQLFEVPAGKLHEFMRTLPSRGIRGFNVTIPYKEQIIPYIDGYLSESARVIGAVNTVAVDAHGRRSGYNTDCVGFTRHCKELKVSPRKVALIGAGGAAKAVCGALGKMGVEEIALYDIDTFRTLELFKRFHALYPATQFNAVSTIDELTIEKKDVLINASPVGMNPEDPLLVNPSVLRRGLFVYDLVYNPSVTKLLEAAAQKGCRVANGLGMLLYQGVEALNIWIKPKKAPLEVMRAALVKGAKSV